MSIDLACVIYADEEENKLKEKLRQIWADDDSVFSDYNNEIVVLRNLDFDPTKRQVFPDGFLHFRQRIEIFPDESKMIKLEGQIDIVSMILKHLWSQGIPAVAACDYEEHLPNNGGYKSTDIPWAKLAI